VSALQRSPKSHATDIQQDGKLCRGGLPFCSTILVLPVSQTLLFLEGTGKVSPPKNHFIIFS
jgi:hypothetical protein